MKLLPVALLLLSILCLSSCGKFRCTVIEGHILEYGSDKPIEGAKVPILIGFLTGPIQGGYETKGTAITDASGHFQWESDEDIQNDWYAIGKIKADQYFSLNWNASGDYHTSIEYGDHYNNTMHLDPHAYLYLHVEDVPEVESEFLRISGAGFNTIETFSLGKSFNETLVVKGNQNIELYFKRSFGELHTVTLNIEAHDTLYYHLKY